ncbi:MAG: DUF3300 domain-containing protein [Oxalobacter formigenes]|nr:DUF3300 domain-containing protein [Oxalobacter formigenes]
MLAPVALYPDRLLAEVLEASRFPGEVGEASRWRCHRPDMAGKEALRAAKGKPWKESIKTLLFFPGVLAAMSARMEWTAKMGRAFDAQQKDVLDRIQYLHRKAKATGNLKPDERITITIAGGDIAIEPVSQERVYVPCYYPSVVYGSWQPPIDEPHWQLPRCGDTRYLAGCNSWGEAVRFHYSRFHGRIDWLNRRVNSRVTHR